MYTGTIKWQSLFWLNDNVCYVLSFKSFFHGTFILRMFDLYWWFLIFLLQAVLLKNCMLTVNLHFSDSKCKCLFLHETWKQTTVVYVKTQNSEHLSLVIAPHSYLVFCSSVSSGPVLCEVHQNSLCAAGSEQAVTVHKTWGIHSFWSWSCWAAFIVSGREQGLREDSPDYFKLILKVRWIMIVSTETLLRISTNYLRFRLL